MKTSAAGRDKLIELESARFLAYQDDAGVWTNGVGHTGPDVFKGQQVDQRQVDEWLEQDLRRFESAVNRAVKVPLTQNQFDALVIFAFNVGVAAFTNSTLLKKLNAGDYEAVPAELLKWNKITFRGRKVASRGLTNRRAAEAALWTANMGNSPFLRPEPPRPKPVAQSNTGRGLGVSSIATLGAVASDSAQQVQVLADYSETIRWIFIALTIAGIGMTAYGYMNARKREEQ